MPMKPLGLLLLACLACEAAVPVRLQVVLGSASVRVNASFTAKIELVDAHALPAHAASPCAVTVTVVDADTKATVQQANAPSIAAGAVSTSLNLVLRRAGFYGIRASTSCPRIQEGLIYVRAGTGTAELLHQPRFLLVAQPLPKGNIDVFYPQDANSLTADGKNKAQIQVFVAPPINFSLAFDSSATVNPNPLRFSDSAGDATANLTSTHPGDFTAIVSPSSIPRGYSLHTHPNNPPMHHFLPDIEFLQVTASSQRGVPLNSPVTLTVQLLDGEKRAVSS